MPVKWKNRDLEKIDQVLNDDWSFRLLPKQPSFVPTLERLCVMAQYARSRVVRNPTVGQLVRYFRRRKGGVGGGRDRGLGGKMVLLGPARVLAVEQPTEVESQVAAVVWLAHEVSLIRAAPEHLVNCSSLDTSLFEAANPDSALPAASWLRDLRNSRRTEYADLGNPPTESERVNAWQDPDGREKQLSMVIFSHHHQIQMLCRHLQSPESQVSTRILLEILTVLHLVSMLSDFVTALDDFSHDQIHIRVHTMNQRTHLACEMNWGLLLGMDSQSVLMRQIMP